MESKSNIQNIKEPLGPLAEVRDIVKVPEALLFFPGEHARLPWRCERRHFSGKLLVKVADIFLATDGRDEGWGHFPLQQCFPVHILK